MRRSLAAACLIFSLVSVQSVVADPSLKELAARTEVRPIETLTLTDQQFLTGDKSGKAAVIAGELRLPQGAAGRLPAVVLMHGSGAPVRARSSGRKPSTKWGIASFLVDSFSGRGLTSVSAEPGDAWSLQHDPRRVSCSWQPFGAPADRSLPHRAHGVLARRPDGALRKPQAIPSGVGSGGRLRGLHSALRLVQPHAHRRYRRERRAHPHVSWFGGRLRPGGAVPRPMSSGCGLPAATCG